MSDPAPPTPPAPDEGSAPTPEPPAPAPAPAPAPTPAPAADHGHHELPFNPFIIFVVLVILTAVSYGADQLQQAEALSTGTISAIVMFVSVVKASLVIAFFMHFKYEGVWKYVLTIPPLIMAVWIMVSLIPDIGNRERQEDAWTHRNAVKPAEAPAQPGKKPAGGH